MLLDNQMGFWKMQKCKKRHYACDEYYERGRRRRRELYWRIFVAVSNRTYSVGHQQWMRRRQDCKSEFVGVIHALKIKFKKKYVNCVFSRVFLASLWHFVWTICRAKLEHHSLSNLSNSSLRDAKKNTSGLSKFGGNTCKLFFAGITATKSIFCFLAWICSTRLTCL